MSDINALLDIIESRDRLVARLRSFAVRLEESESAMDRFRSDAELRGVRIDELQALVKATEEDRDHWKAGSERDSSRFDTLQALVKATETDRDAWKTRCEVAGPRIDELQAIVKMIEDDRDRWKSRSESLETTLRANESRISAMRGEIESMPRWLVAWVRWMKKR